MSLWEMFSSPLRKTHTSGSGSWSPPKAGELERSCGGSSSEPHRSSHRRLNWAEVSAVGPPKLLSSQGEVVTSQVLSPFTLQQVAVALPSRFAYADWRLLYSTGVHGISVSAGQSPRLSTPTQATAH